MYIDILGWSDYIRVHNIKHLPLNEQMKRYNYYLMEQQAVMSVTTAASAGGRGQSNVLPPNYIEFVVSTVGDTSFTISSIEVSDTANITFDWGDGTTDSYTVSVSDSFSHTYPDTDQQYTCRISFDNIGLVTTLFSSNGGANIVAALGLPNLTNITNLELDSSGLTTLDVSGMSSLTRLDISDCVIPGTSTKSLTSINLSGLTSLETLNLDDSNFSSGFPNLSDCTALVNMDFDQCDLVGSIDVSNLPALELIDFSQNFGLTELIISRNQPIGANANEAILSDCAFSQTVVDNILLELASGSVSSGYVDLSNNTTGTNATPGQVGRDSLFILDSRGWSFDVVNGNHTAQTLVYEVAEGAVCTSAITGTYYIASGSSLTIGNKLYTNSDAWAPAVNGWYATGSLKFEVSGSGTIVTTGSCV